MGDRQAGFTLTEVLVAAALSSLVALIVVGLMRTMQIGAREHGCMVESAESVRVATARLADDVRVATTVVLQTSSLTLTTVGSDQKSYTYTYTLTGGTLTRLVSVNNVPSGPTAVLAQNLDTNQSSFMWNPSPQTPLPTVHVKLVLVPGSGGICNKALAGGTTVETYIDPYSLRIP